MNGAGSPRYHLRDPRALAAMRAIDGMIAPLRTAVPPPVPSRPERLLVAAWAHLGDLLLAMPALAALRARWPAARIDLLTGTAAAPLARASGLVDEVLALDHWALDRSGRPLPQRVARYLREAARLRRALRDRRHALSIDLYGWFPNTAALTRAAGIPVRVGFASGGGGPLLTHPVAWPEGLHVGEAPRALLGAIDPDHDWGPLAPLWPGPAAPRPADGPGDYVLVHPGTGERDREWPDAHWITLLRALRDAGQAVRLTGAGARERDRCARLAATVPGVVDASGGDWAAFAALVRDARAVVCLESLCAHVASAFQRPTVCLFGHVNDPALWGPRHPGARLVRPPERGASGEPAVPGRGGALAGLAPEPVIAAVRESLAHGA